MPETISTPLPKRRRWLRLLIFVAVALVVLMVAAYFIGTSSSFLKSMVLPRVGKALNSSITVSDISIHPFSQIVLHDLKVQPDGSEPLVSASEVRASYHLWDMLHGRIYVDEIALVSPDVELVENPDGSSNLDPLMKALQAQPGAEKKASPPKQPSGPLQIDVGKFTLSNANIREVKNYAGGHRDLMELTNVNITLANLKNGQQAKLDLAADIRMDNNPPAGSGGSLAASLKGELDCSLTPDLKPGSVTGGVKFAVSQADGAFGSFNALSAALDCDVTPTDLKQLTLKFRQSDTPLGELDVTGPFDAEKMEGKLDLELHGIDKRLLNLVGEKSGMDFGSTTIGAGAEIQLAKAGTEITVTGKVNAGKVQLTRAGQTTPTLDVNAGYDVTVDRTAQTATLRSLDLAGTQGASPLLDAHLTSPMNLAWGSNAGNVGDASLNLAVTAFNLADWRPFLGNTLAAGVVGVKLNLDSRQGGKQIAFNLNSDVTGLTARVGSNEISQAAIHLSAQGNAAQFKQVTLSNYNAQIALQNRPALSSSGSATCDLASGAADLKFKVQAALVPLLGAFQQSGLSVSSGDLSCDLSAQYEPKGGSSVKGDLQVSKLVMNRPGQPSPAAPLDVGLHVDASLEKQTATVRQLVVALTPTDRATNQLQLSGQIDFSKSDALQGDFKLAADSLDLTGYYDMFANGTNAAAKKAAPASPATNPNQEPAAVHLPVQYFALAANIGAIYLHEVAITNFQTTLKIDGSHIVVKPLQLALNGAPVDASADVDLGVPGYQYKVSYNANAIPLTPLVDTFMPDRAGDMGGTLTSSAQITGAGITGASLQKNLAGEFDLDLTNLNLSVDKVRSPVYRLIINVVATIPELIGGVTSGNLLSAASAVLSGVTGQGSLMGELRQSPIEDISVQALAGNGQVNLKSATVQSAAFETGATGNITLNSVLTNSTINIPVTVSLSQPIAKKLNMASATASTNGAYVPLPQFLTVTGTVGAPKSKTDKMALVGVAAHSFSGNLLNPSGSNSTPVGNLLNQVLNFRK